MNTKKSKNSVFATMLALLCLFTFGAQAAIVYNDDMEAYDVLNPSDFEITTVPSGNWVPSSLASNASRIFDTGNYGGTRLWISNVDGSSIQSAGITLAPNTNHIFSAALVVETSNGARQLEATYDIKAGATAGAAVSIIGGPVTVIVRGDNLVIPGSKEDQIFKQIFNTGPLGGGGDLVFIEITRVGIIVTGGWFGVDDVTIDDFVPPVATPTIITPTNGQTAVSPENALLHWYLNTNSSHTSQSIYLDTVTPPVTKIDEVVAGARDYTFSGLADSTIYYARVDAFNILGTEQSNVVMFTTGQDSIASSTPPGSGQILHLDATVGVLNSGGTPAADGQAVQTWQDQSGSGNDVINADGAQQPVFENLSDSGQPSIVFDGTDRLIAGATTDFDFGVGPMEYFWAAKSTDVSPSPDNERLIFGKANDISLNGFMVGERIGGVAWRHYASPAGWFTAPGVADPTTWSTGNYNSSASPQTINAYADGIQYTTNFTPGTEFDYDTTVLFAVGDQNGSDGLDTDEFAGEIAEVIFYNRLLSDAERSSVRKYLAVKYDQQFKYDFVSPTVNITTANNTNFLSTDGDVTLEATSVDQELGVITQVEFFANGVSIGVDTSGSGTNGDEFSFDWASAPLGSYQITAVATDGDSPAAFYAIDEININVVAPIYVTVAGGGDGTSWTTPLNIASAVALTNASGGGVIYMKTGTYVTTETITLSNPTAIYGGFAGTEVGSDDRTGNYESDFPTTISGNNTHRVINADGSPGLVLDGFIITEGFTTGGGGNAFRGAGLRYSSTAAFATINRCTFFNNNTSAYGAAAYLGDAIVTDCRFTSNTSVVTGGAISSAGTPVHFLDNVIFDQNLCRGVFGGAYFAGNGAYYLSHCTFVNNIGNNGVADPANGDGINKRNGGGMSILNSLFVGHQVAVNHNDEGANGGANRVFMTNCFFDTADPNVVTSEEIAVPVVESNPLSGSITFLPGGFQLPAGSPAVNAGALDDGTLDGFPALAGVPATDIIGVPRADQLPDIGAYEIPFDEIVVAPIPINFGTVATVSVSSQTVTILNGTANQVTVTSVTLTGSEASHFALDLGSAVFPLVLDSAESFTVELVFNSTIQLPGFNRAVQINVLSSIATATGQVLAVNGNITRASTWNLME